MFTLLVGPPGVGKSRAINVARYLWQQTKTLSIAPVSLTHKGLIDQLASEECHKQSTDGSGFYEEYHSILIPAAEFGVFMPSNDLAFMNALNDLYDCGDVYEERTRTGGVVRIDNPHVHLIAGTQPKYIGEIFPEAAFGMGFTSRIVMVYAGDPVKISLFSEKKMNKELGQKLAADLASIANLKGRFGVTAEAIAALENWHLVESDEDKPNHSRLQHYVTRRIAHVLKLCMIFCALRSNDMTISIEDFQNAKDTLLLTEEDMPEIFKEIRAGGQASEIEEVFHFMVRHHAKTKKPISEHRLINFLSSRLPVNQIPFLITTMLHAKMIEEHPLSGKTSTPGGIQNRLFVPKNLTQAE
jgi:hypothetical protein